MRHASLIATSVATVAALALCAGCASSDRLPTRAPAPGASGAPGGSASPTGPAATAATGTPPPLGTHAVASVAGATVTCPDGAPLSDPENGRGSGAALGAGVEVQAVVRCESVLRTYPGIGQWSVQLAEVADSGLSPFLAALRTPSQQRPGNIICPGYLLLAPWFALVDASGTVLHPPLPTDQCGQVAGPAIAALAKLDFRVVDAVRVQQTESPEVITSGCQQNWKDIVAVEADRQSVASAGVFEPFDTGSPTASALVCLYRAGPAQSGLRVGTLIKGGTVSGQAATNIVGQLGSLTPLAGPACPDADTFAVVTYGAGSAAYAEIDGCNRVLTADNRLGRGGPKLIAQLNAALGSS